MFWTSVQIYLQLSISIQYIYFKYSPVLTLNTFFSKATASSISAPPFSRFRARGPWDKAYISSGLSWRIFSLRRLLCMQPCAHLEVGSVALQIWTWQWKNTYGCLLTYWKASRLKRSDWSSGLSWNCSVSSSSTEHLHVESKKLRLVL